jgi:AraC-like DNA-binding protein
LIDEMLSQLEEPFTGEVLFDHLPGIVFFIKNSRGQYLVVNNTLVERCGLQEKSQLLGRTPAEVLRPPLGQSFEAQDQVVLQTGRPLLSQLELHVYPSREVGWCLTSKLPLRKRGGSIAGLVGVSQDLRLPDVDTEDYQHISTAVAYAEANLSAPPTVVELAKIAEMSPYQLDRRMRRVFGLTTGQWLLKLRVDMAGRQLQTTDDSIAAIALQVGYSDQSAFTRQFRRATGLSPRDYRNAQRRKS